MRERDYLVIGAVHYEDSGCWGQLGDVVYISEMVLFELHLRLQLGVEEARN